MTTNPTPSFRKTLLMLLTLAAFALPLRAQDTLAELDSRYEVAGTFLFGVVDNETGELVVDTIFESVEIVKDNLFECAYKNYKTASGNQIALPAPVLEYYNSNGILLTRSYSALLKCDKIPYETTLAFAQAAGLKDLESLAKYNIGLDYEYRGQRREAYQYYMRAYKACPAHSFAKEKADAVQASVADDRAKAMEKWNQALREAEIARQQREAQMAASLNYWNSVAFNTQLQQQNAKRQANATPASSQTTQQSSAKQNATSPKNKKTSTTKKRSVTGNIFSHDAPQFGITRERAEELGINDCPICHGGQRCIFCGGKGKIVGYVTRTCDSCNGTGICSRCKGTGKWKN